MFLFLFYIVVVLSYIPACNVSIHVLNTKPESHFRKYCVYLQF